jgi:hypothetical protein
LAYFRDRYGAASEGMRAKSREPVLNKATAFTPDPHFRPILGQREGSLSLVDA